MQTPASFEYKRATSVDDAVATLEKLGPDARIIAGGHSLLPMMKLRLANPEHLIDINDLDELSYIREAGDEIRIGALTRHRELLESQLLARHFPCFADAEHVIADPVVRNRGTIGGSLCQADAAEDLSAVCTALKAKVVIAGSDGERVVGMDDFHVGPYQTAVQDAELLVEVRLPLRRGGTSAHEKVERRAGDWAIVAVTGALWMNGGKIEDAGIALSAVGPTTIHLTRAEELLRGKAPAEEIFAQAGTIASEDCSPSADGRGPIDYKRHLAGVLTRRALSRAAARARHQEPEHASLDHGQRRAGHARGRAAQLLVHFLRETLGPDRHALGLRHLELRRLRRADGRRAGQVVHDPRGRWPRATRSARSSRWRSTARWTRSSRASTRSTALQCGFCTPGHDHDRARAAGREPRPDRGRDP